MDKRTPTHAYIIERKREGEGEKERERDRERGKEISIELFEEQIEHLSNNKIQKTKYRQLYEERLHVFL